VSLKKHAFSRILGRLCMSVCARVRARAWAALPRLCVMLFRPPSRSHRACVCVLPGAQSMDADPMAFTVTSDRGAAVEGRVLVRGVGRTSRGRRSWALVGAPIDSMLTAAGDAWAEFVLVEKKATGTCSCSSRPRGWTERCARCRRQEAGR